METQRRPKGMPQIWGFKQRWASFFVLPKLYTFSMFDESWWFRVASVSTELHVASCRDDFLIYQSHATEGEKIIKELGLVRFPKDCTFDVSPFD
jgi:hypothetical protein